MPSQKSTQTLFSKNGTNNQDFTGLCIVIFYCGKQACAYLGFSYEYVEGTILFGTTVVAQSEF